MGGLSTRAPLYHREIKPRDGMQCERQANRYPTLVFTDIEGLLERSSATATSSRLGASFWRGQFVWVGQQRTPVIIAVVRIWRPFPSTPAGSIALEPHATRSRRHARWGISLASSD